MRLGCGSRLNPLFALIESETMKGSRRTHSNFAGCLLGGAIGDALGAPVEFLNKAAIFARYGGSGITDFDVAYGRRGAVTDDTQMTLFTAEGLLRAQVRGHLRGLCDIPSVLYHAYIRWLHTQGLRSANDYFWRPYPDGWLAKVSALYSQRAPGMTCISALQGRAMGTMDTPLNDSKGCGGVMRVAPVGLWAQDVRFAFDLGCQAAAITHGHPSGYLSAGCLAAMVCAIANGHELQDAVDVTGKVLMESKRDGYEECAAALRRALQLWQDKRTTPSPSVVESLGGGWVGEEALAIGVYCALASQHDFTRAVCLAVNHSGDSDSTGTITGNLVGLLLGVESIPARWLDELELRNEIEALAQDLHIGYEESDAWRDRYPGW